MKKVFIIAEAGVNHNGRLETAMDLVSEAAAAGADAVKFQSFVAEELLRKDTPLAEYQKKNETGDDTQFDMIKRLELQVNDYRQLIECCRQNNIEFISSPFSITQVDVLADLKVESIKIPSGEIDNLPYLRRIGQLNKKIYLSTGMSDLDDITAALEILTNSGTNRDNIVILHCNTDYPTCMEDVHLRAMITIQNHFNLTVGYSDHTLGIEVPIAAVALGAAVIEKHFTLDRNMVGPDHKASLDPETLQKMTAAIRNIEIALGDAIKKPTASELKNKSIVRKSIVAAKAIKSGQIFNDENLMTKRPATGMSPMKWDELIGTVATRDYCLDEDI